MFFDPVEGGLQIVDQHSTEKERDAQSQGIGQKHQHPLNYMALLGSQHQSRPQKCTHTRCPTQGKYHTKEHSGEESHLTAVYCFAAASEQIHFEYAQKIESKENHYQSGNHIHCAFVFLQKAANGASQCAHCYKNYGKSTNKSHCTQQGPFCGALPTACKIGDIDGQHRKQARRYEGDDSLQESYCVLHEPLHPFPNTPDNSQPIKPI